MQQRRDRETLLLLYMASFTHGMEPKHFTDFIEIEDKIKNVEIELMLNEIKLFLSRNIYKVKNEGNRFV